MTKTRTRRTATRKRKSTGRTPMRGWDTTEPGRRHNWQSKEDEECMTRRWARRGVGGGRRGGGLNVIDPVRRHNGRNLGDAATDGTVAGGSGAGGDAYGASTDFGLSGAVFRAHSS